MMRRLFCRALLVIATIFVILMFSGLMSAHGNSDNAFEHVKQVQEKHTAKLLALKGVVGTAVGVDTEENPNIKVFVEGPGVAGIPKKLDEVNVEVVVTGKIYAMPQLEEKAARTRIDPTAWFARPVPIGVSTGNIGEISAGTISCRVKSSSGTLFALSNNHVYALENDAPIGSYVLQPGRYDGGTSPDDVIGTLSDYVPIDFDGSNTIDAAIATIIKDGTTPRVGKSTPSNGYGTPLSATVPAEVNMKVQKYGRTSSLTKGTITAFNATLNIGYSSGTALFTNQIIVQSSRPFLKAGDSGSLLVTSPGKNPVGLLFAADASGKYAIANDIGTVLDAFNVTIDGQ